MLGTYQVKFPGKPCVAAADVDNTSHVAVWCYVTTIGLGTAIASKFLLVAIAKLLA